MTEKAVLLFARTYSYMQVFNNVKVLQKIFENFWNNNMQMYGRMKRISGERTHNI